MSTLANQLVRAEVTSESVAEPGLAIGLETAMAPKRLLSKFSCDQKGSVAVIFGLTLFPVVFFVGMAVDFSKALTIRAQTQVALDAASIAAGRAYMTAPAGTTTAGKYALAKAAAESYYASARPKSVMQAQKADGTADNGLVFIEPTGAQTEFTVKATNWIKTPFLSAAEALKKKNSPGTDPSIPVGCQDSGWRCMKIVSTAGAMIAAGGSNTGISIETSLMLDVSGSMGPGYGDGNKMADMKTAAKDFIDILVWDGQATSATKSRVALAPFSQSVNCWRICCGSDRIDCDGHRNAGGINRSLRPVEEQRFVPAGTGQRRRRTPLIFVPVLSNASGRMPTRTRPRARPTAGSEIIRARMRRVAMRTMMPCPVPARSITPTAAARMAIRATMRPSCP